MSRAALHVVFIAQIAIACPWGCGEETSLASLGVVEGENLPCLGVRRIRVTAFRDVVDGESAEAFGEFYDSQGSCDLSAGLPLELQDLPFTGSMWVRVEGFDSSKRRMCSGETDLFSKDQVKSGSLPDLVLDRDPAGGQDPYPRGTLVIQPLPDFPVQADALTFVMNPGTPEVVNGTFVTAPGAGFDGAELVLSSLPARAGNWLLVVARADNDVVGQWESPSFDILASDMFIPVSLQKVSD